MTASVFVPHTGWWWLDVLVYVISGGAFGAICYLFPQYYRDVVRPTLDFVRTAYRQNDYDKSPEESGKIFLRPMTVDLTELFPQTISAEGTIYDDHLVIVDLCMGEEHIQIEMKIDRMANCLERLRRAQSKLGVDKQGRIP